MKTLTNVMTKVAMSGLTSANQGRAFGVLAVVPENVPGTTRTLFNTPGLVDAAVKLAVSPKVSSEDQSSAWAFLCSVMRDDEENTSRMTKVPGIVELALGAATSNDQHVRQDARRFLAWLAQSRKKAVQLIRTPGLLDFFLVGAGASSPGASVEPLRTFLKGLAGLSRGIDGPLTMYKMRGASVMQILFAAATRKSDPRDMRMMAWEALSYLAECRQLFPVFLPSLPGLLGALADMALNECEWEEGCATAFSVLALLCKHSNSHDAHVAMLNAPGLVHNATRAMRFSDGFGAFLVILAMNGSNETKRRLASPEFGLADACMRLALDEGAPEHVREYALLAMESLGGLEEIKLAIAQNKAFLSKALQLVRRNDALTTSFMSLLLELSLSPTVAHMLDDASVLDAICACDDDLRNLVLGSDVGLDANRLAELGVSVADVIGDLFACMMASLSGDLFSFRLDSALRLVGKVCDCDDGGGDARVHLVAGWRCLHAAIAQGLARSLAEGNVERVALAVSTLRKCLLVVRRDSGSSTWSSVRGVGDDVLVALVAVVASSSSVCIGGERSSGGRGKGGAVGVDLNLDVRVGVGLKSHTHDRTRLTITRHHDQQGTHELELVLVSHVEPIRLELLHGLLRHANGALHDDLARIHERLRGLLLEHRRGDLRRVVELVERDGLDRDSRRRDARLQHAHELELHVLRLRLELVVRVPRHRELHRRRGLRVDEPNGVVHVEQRPARVRDAVRHHRRNDDGVTRRIRDLLVHHVHGELSRRDGADLSRTRVGELEPGRGVVLRQHAAVEHHGFLPRVHDPEGADERERAQHQTTSHRQRGALQLDVVDVVGVALPVHVVVGVGDFDGEGGGLHGGHWGGLLSTQKGELECGCRARAAPRGVQREGWGATAQHPTETRFTDDKKMHSSDFPELGRVLPKNVAGCGWYAGRRTWLKRSRTPLKQHNYLCGLCHWRT